ncbi:condensation domain-containing protein [Cellulosimicrobium marinum]|uniref:condensation domain-containing protein n=1 Tax=Cellulosimicrobium marinum TaxID=1638992 RepID=UPI001E5A9237|nr:condensation domain-containing protein [Cellulosimicrobium marinum]MCB7135529.1 condensation domain-containing protein [Cellulosimicrobium marinum]
MRATHDVEVRGPAGSGPATWGQTAIRRALAALAPLDHQFNLTWGGPLDRPVPVATALRVVRDVVERHDALRTRLVPRGDGYAQELTAHAAVPVVEERVATVAEVPVVAARLRHELWGAPFAYARELPVRAGLVTVGDAVHHAVVVVAHTAADGWALPVLDADLVALASGTPLPALDGTWTPLDEAAWQASPAGRRHDDAARARVLRTMRAAPAETFPPRPPGGTPTSTGAPTSPGVPPAAPRARYRQTVLRSRRLGPAADRLAARWRVSPAVVLLAASCRALADAAGRDDVVLQVMSSNRFRPALARSVATVAMEGLLHVDGLDAPFEDVTARVWRAAMTAYRSAYYDKDRLVHDAASDLDARHDTTCWYNDRRGTGPDRNHHARPTGSRRLARADAPDNQGGISLALHLVDAPGGGVDLVLTVDTARLDDAIAEAVLRATERTVLDAGRARAAG